MKKLIIAGLSSLLLTPFSAFAYEQGDMILRVGATSVEPSDSTKPDGVWVDGNTQLGINFVYMATSNIGVEVLAATPFKHDILLKGVGVIGTTKHLPPTISAQYYFNNSSIVTPYIGAGLNYTVFFDENLKDLNKVSSLTSIDNIELKDSIGLALQVGADFAINDNWGINLDIRKIDISTEVESAPAGVAGIEVDVNPMVYSLTALYKF